MSVLLTAQMIDVSNTFSTSEVSVAKFRPPAVAQSVEHTTTDPGFESFKICHLAPRFLLSHCSLLYVFSLSISPRFICLFILTLSFSLFHTHTHSHTHPHPNTNTHTFSLLHPPTHTHIHTHSHIHKLTLTILLWLSVIYFSLLST